MAMLNNQRVGFDSSRAHVVPCVTVPEILTHFHWDGSIENWDSAGSSVGVKKRNPFTTWWILQLSSGCV